MVPFNMNAYKLYLYHVFVDLFIFCYGGLGIKHGRSQEHGEVGAGKVLCFRGHA